MRSNNESGVALLSAILVLMLMSAMVVGFMAMIDADQRTGVAGRDQTVAYAAAHAGVEKLTADLGQVFQTNYSPTGTQVTALTSTGMAPAIPGVTYLRPDGSSGYRITFTDTVGANGLGGPDGNPDVDDVNGTPLTSGNFEGLRGLITGYDMEVTARAPGSAEVRLRRTMQTVAIPVFQFGMFSENSLSFFAGPNFAFGGRVHTNEHLFLKQDDNATLTLNDRASAVGEIIRKRLSNGVASHDGTVRMALANGCPAAPTAANGACRNLADTEGSQVDGQGSANNEPTWTSVSTGDYGGWIKNGRTGARRLDLQIVRDGAEPIDLIRVPPAGEAVTSSIARQRFYHMASVRVLLADNANDLVPGHPGAVGAPVPLSGSFGPLAVLNGLPLGVPLIGLHPFAWSGGLPLVVLPALDTGFRTQLLNLATLQLQSTIGGFILINKQNKNGAWTDVTRDVLSLGFTGRRLSTGNILGGTLDQPDMDNACPEYHPNAVVRVQRVADNALNLLGGTCGALIPPVGAIVSTGLDFWPNVLYDPREGMLRDNQAARPVSGGQQQLYFGGVMHYVELDVNNLRRWLYGEIGNANAGCPSGNATATCPMDVTGYVAYFSDRRTNRNAANAETGELGWEDNINNNAAGTPNDALDAPFVDVDLVDRWSEDVNQSATLQTYGNTARSGGSSMVLPGGFSALLYPNATATNIANYSLWQNPIARNVGRVNQAFFFRRALKLTHGGLGNLPRNGSQGLTVASENPVYVEGNFNACNNVVPNAANNYAQTCVGGVGFGNTPGVDHVSAAVIADAVTFLSSTWNDIKSFRNPHDATLTGVTNADARQAVTTWYRLGIIAGKGLSFPRAGYASANDHADFGTDGGVHNFIRYIENWGNASLNYRGSLLTFYTSRQAVGTYKCCDIVYTPPARGYNFDTDFATPSLLPPRTPMFRDINTLTFRQILRPNQP